MQFCAHEGPAEDSGSLCSWSLKHQVPCLQYWGPHILQRLFRLIKDYPWILPINFINIGQRKHTTERFLFTAVFSHMQSRYFAYMTKDSGEKSYIKHIRWQNRIQPRLSQQWGQHIFHMAWFLAFTALCSLLAGTHMNLFHIHYLLSVSY